MTILFLPSDQGTWNTPWSDIPLRGGGWGGWTIFVTTVSERAYTMFVTKGSYFWLLLYFFVLLVWFFIFKLHKSGPLMLASMDLITFLLTIIVSVVLFIALTWEGLRTAALCNCSISIDYLISIQRFVSLFLDQLHDLLFLAHSLLIQLDIKLTAQYIILSFKKRLTRTRFLFQI